MTTSNNGMLK